jgi:hypothetical protein
MRITPCNRGLPPTPRVTRFYPLRYSSIDVMILETSIDLEESRTVYGSRDT